MGKKHITIKMARRVEELSVCKFSKLDLTDEERNLEFLCEILKEWFIQKDPEDSSKDYKRIVWDENEEFVDGDEPEPIPCVCGHSIRKGEYYVMINVINGYMLKLGKTCYKYVKEKILKEKDMKQRIKKKLMSCNGNKNKFFDNMSDYSKAVVKETIEEWTLPQCVRYLDVYQNNGIIRPDIINAVMLKSRCQTLKQIDRLEGLKRQVNLETRDRNKAREEVVELKIKLGDAQDQIKKLTRRINRENMIGTNRNIMMNIMDDDYE